MRTFLIGLCFLAATADLGCQESELAATVPVWVVKSQKFVRIVEADGTLRAVRTTPVSVPPDAYWAMRVTWLALDGSTVKRGDPLVRFDDLDLQDQLYNAKSDFAVDTALKQKEEVMQLAAKDDRRRASLGAQRDLALSRTFQAKDNEIFSRDQIISDEIDGKLYEVKADARQKIERVDGRLDEKKLELLAVDVKQATSDIHRAEKGLRSLELKAPHEGVLILRRNNGEPLAIGDTVWRSQILADVATVEQLEGEVFVLEAEAAGLVEGRTAEVSLESQPGRSFPGTVKRVERVAKSRQGGKEPTQYFGVVVSLNKTLPDVMKPGQRVRAKLFLHEEQALVAPRPALFDQGGTWVVYKRDGRGAFSAVPVKLGSATAGLLAIESGLRDGDVIALRDPGKALTELVPGAAQPAEKKR
jgi:multidrug efflux pump subunit AcrA (membrane-fusion protein)